MRGGLVAGHGPTRASYLASTLSATLELVKEGELEARQLEHFAEIYLRARRGEAAPDQVTEGPA
jgi:segregation and condensation protein A